MYVLVKTALWINADFFSIATVDSCGCQFASKISQVIVIFRRNYRHYKLILKINIFLSDNL
jgi:hypothetical protein